MNSNYSFYTSPSLYTNVSISTVIRVCEKLVLKTRINEKHLDRNINNEYLIFETHREMHRYANPIWFLSGL